MTKAVALPKNPRFGARSMVVASMVAAAVLLLPSCAQRAEPAELDSILDSAVTDPTSTPPVPSIDAVLVQRGMWSFKNGDGYSYNMSISLSDVLAFDDIRGASHPLNSNLVVGQQCGDGPTYSNAAVVLGSMTAVATTPQFDTPIDMHVNIGMRTRQQSSAAAAMGARLEFAQSFGKNDGSCKQNDQYARWPSFGVNFKNPVPTGTSVTAAFLVIIKDYFDVPGGDREFGQSVPVFATSGQLSSDSKAARAAMYYTKDEATATLVS
ncbi:hypothetical protein [Rhodococcus sp. T7]|uniref:hypothetical protein n=1 Tax=Rhodococcus sp. T7 TaxID=627444 RepID=UPI00135A4F9B|nr:hypothetical protein [Rhodococcus sp. T7]KAF0963216.1 hypothetical protein MLGJGCBP_03654 [Rhodococcus sp. T7]